jgi:hypothetical protein
MSAHADGKDQTVSTPTPAKTFGSRLLPRPPVSSPILFVKNPGEHSRVRSVSNTASKGTNTMTI